MKVEIDRNAKEAGRKAFWLALLAIIMLATIECRNADFRTIDEIRVVPLEEVQGALGHLIQFTVEKNNVSAANSATFKVALLVRDEDISQNNFYIILTLITDSSSPEHAKYADIFNLFERSTGLSTTTLPDDERPLMLKVGSGTVQAHFDRCLVIQTPEENVCLKLNLGIGKSLTDKIERLVQGGAKVIDIGLTPEPPPIVEPPPVVGPPAITTLSAVSDNTDTTEAMAGDTVTLTFSTNKPIVLQRSRVSFVPTNGSHGRTIKAVQGADNQYTSTLRITDGMSDGMLQVRVTLVDDDGNTSGVLVRDTGVTISQPDPPPVVDPPVIEPTDEPSADEPLVHDDPKHWRSRSDRAAFLLTDYSNALQGVIQKWNLSDDDIQDRIRRGLSGVLRREGVDAPTVKFAGIKMVIYDMYSVCVEERPEVAADAVETGILIHPIANNRLFYDWMRLGLAYPEKTKEERWQMFRQLVRHWGAEKRLWRTDKIGINELNFFTNVPEEGRVYVQPPDDPFSISVLK